MEAVLARIVDGESAVQVCGLARKHLAVMGADSRALAGLDAHMAGVLARALGEDPGLGLTFLRAASSLLAAWPATSSLVLEQPGARAWVAACNADGVPLATHAAVCALNPRTVLMRRLETLGAQPLPDEHGLLPWQAALGYSITRGAVPKSWLPRGAGEMARGMAAALNHAWANGRDREGMRLDDIWRCLTAVNWGLGESRGGLGRESEVGRSLLAGHFLMVAEGGGTSGRMERNFGSHDVDRALRDLTHAEWLALTAVAPRSEGGLREDAQGWPIAGAVMLAYLVGRVARYQMGRTDDAADGGRLLDRALAGLSEATDAELDRPLAWSADTSTSLRGLAGLCTFAFRDYFTGFAGKMPRGGWQSTHQGAVLDRRMLDAALAGRSLLYVSASRARRAQADHAMLHALLGAGNGGVGEMAPGRCTLTGADRVEGALQIMACGDLLRPPSGVRSQPVAALIDMEAIDGACLHEHARRRDATFLCAIGRLPEALAEHVLLVDGEAFCERGLRHGVKAQPLLPHEAADGVPAERPTALAIMEGWEEVCRAQMSAAGMDRLAWTEAMGKVFGRCAGRHEDWRESDDAAGWLARRLARDNATAVSVKTWLPRLLILLEKRGRALMPEHAKATRRWLGACARSEAATRALVVTLGAWLASSGPRAHPALLFQRGGLGDCSTLRGACEASMIKDGQAGIEALLGPWQAVSLGVAAGGGRPRRRA